MRIKGLEELAPAEIGAAGVGRLRKARGLVSKENRAKPPQRGVTELFPDHCGIYDKEIVFKF
jgi:hypothetical protein